MMTGIARADGRAYYLDWVRIIVILILVPFHSAITFTTVGDCYIKHPQSVPIVDALLGPMSSWVMPLLFVVAGGASFYALQRRMWWEYERERRLKLLIPFFAGFLLIVPPMTYLGARFNGTFEGSLLEFFPRFFTSGAAPKGYMNWGHFWFLIYLYTFSMILLPLFLRMMRERTRASIVHASAILEKGMWVYLVAVPVMLSETLLRPFFPTFYNLIWDFANDTLFLALMLYGFLFVLNGRIMDNIQRIRASSLLLALALYGVSVGVQTAGVAKSLSPAFPAYDVLMLLAWILAAIGYAKQFLNRRFRFYDYLHTATFPFYVFHYLPVTIAAYFIARSDVNVWLKYLLIVAFAYAATFALYEIVRRVSGVRLLFGAHA